MRWMMVLIVAALGMALLASPGPIAAAVAKGQNPNPCVCICGPPIDGKQLCFCICDVGGDT